MSVMIIFLISGYMSPAVTMHCSRAAYYHLCTGEWRAGEETLNQQGKYIYMDDLREITQCKRVVQVHVHVPIPEPVQVISTPLCQRAWREELRKWSSRLRVG